MKLIDALLNKITMYRLALYYLIGLIMAAMLLSALGYLSYNPLIIVGIASYMTLVCWLTNRIFAWGFDAPTNFESSLITALILTLIITPTLNQQNLLFLSAAAGLAIASKYILAIRSKHIFNPAAMAVALLAIGAGQAASWWVGSLAMLPFVFIGGFLLVRKIERGWMVLTFLGSTIAATVIYTLLGHGHMLTTLKGTLLHSPLFFLAFVMLTEPLTSPATKSGQRWYAALAGVLFPPQVHILSLYTTPELVLVASNAFSYVISPMVKVFPKLTQRLKLAPDTQDFIFALDKPIKYKPGQYMEWTLPHPSRDSRGDRRYFTLASSPTEPNVRLGVKFYDPGSSYKRAMLAMQSDTPIAAAQLGGDFVMPPDTAKELVFIAGGIGVTPYRSMMKYLIDTKQERKVTLLYSERNADEVVYTDIFEAARRQLGAKIFYTLTDQGIVAPPWAHTGFITADTIMAEVPNYASAIFYISGPHVMVKAIQKNLHDLGVPKRQVKTDYFPGY